MYTTQAPNPNLEPFSLQGQDLANPNAPFNGGQRVDPTMDKQKMLANLLTSGPKKPQQTQYVNGWAVPDSGFDASGLASGLASMYLNGQK